jgi:hypothetical protein
MEGGRIGVVTIACAYGVVRDMNQNMHLHDLTPSCGSPDAKTGLPGMRPTDSGELRKKVVLVTVVLDGQSSNSTPCGLQAGSGYR